MIECDDLQLNLSFSGPEKEKEKEEGEGKGSVGARSLRRNRLGQGQGRRVQGEGQREGLRKGLDNSSLRGGRAKSLGRQGAVEKPKPSSNRENPAPVSVVPEKEDSPSLLLGNKKSSTNVVEIERRRKREESRLDDPMQYHARPRELSRNATDVKQLTRSEYIFTRRSFSSINIPEKIVKVLEKDVSDGGFSLRTITRIQSAVIPALLGQKQNILMKSETGSGKTLAYLLPILTDLMNVKPPIDRLQGTFAIILAPTRELCTQIADVVDRLTKCCVSIVGGCITGGGRRKSEKARLRKGVNVLVASPGRMLDHLKSTESFNLNNLRWLVLDEADRLLDMGFENTIMDICKIIGGSEATSSIGPDTSPPVDESLDNAVKPPLQIMNINQKWREQSLRQSKLCRSFSNLSYVMVSATLTSALKRISFPIMGKNGFTVVDAEKESSERVETLADLSNLGKDTGRLDGKLGSTISHTNDDFEVVSAVEKCINSDEKIERELLDNTKTRASDLAQGEQINTPSQLSQYYMMVTCKWRLAALLCFLKAHAREKVMVFFSTCDSVDYHALLLNNAKWPQELDPALEASGSKDDTNVTEGNVVRNENTGMWSYQEGNEVFLNPLESTFSSMILEESMLKNDENKNKINNKKSNTSSIDLNNMYRLHGNVPQRVRQEVYKKFCKAKHGILFCTDVAARGLDLPKIDWIVQYDAPCETTDYVHRIGRTARRGEGGNALIFILPSEAQYLTLLGTHGVKPEPLSLQRLFLDVGAEYIPGSHKFNNRDEMTAVILQRRIETVVLRNKYLLQASRQAFRSFIRAYATHSADTKGIFKVQSLHLGHVAKCFGLRESPSALRNHDDVIGKVFNGMFTKEYLKENKLTKRGRNEKYSLSKQSQKGNDKNRKRQNDRSEGDELKAKKRKNDVNKSNKQKIRKVGLTASGSFRKTEGYFNKKIRVSSSTEFAS